MSHGLCAASDLRLSVSHLHGEGGGPSSGKADHPFEFILIFFLGGLTLTGMMGDEVSATSAFCQIITIGCCHYAIAWLRTRSPKMARMFEPGAPGVFHFRLPAPTGSSIERGVVRGGEWQQAAMTGMKLAPEDVLASARTKGIASLGEIEYAVLERNGAISVIQKEE